jgi:hydrogenase maturation protease
MSTKLIAMGNILMGDDGIAVFLARLLEAELLALGIEVIYGETDIGYCITRVEDGDYLILLDGACLGKQPGEISLLPLCSAAAEETGMTQHGIRFIDLLALYYPRLEGMILAVEAADLSFRYEISAILMDRVHEIAAKLLHIIDSTKTQHNNVNI